MGIRVACSGLVDAEAGSVSSAGFQILRELLVRGYEIDFYSKRSYVYPEELLEKSGFRYVDCSQTLIDRLDYLSVNVYARWLGLRLVHATFARQIVRQMRALEQARRYDLELFLGQWAFGRIPGVPVVSWVQGPPETDSRSVIRHHQTIRSLCGWREYAQLRAYSLFRASLGRPPFQHSDVIICGSSWSKELLVRRYKVDCGTIRQLPYPIDLESFRPAPKARVDRPLELVWLGRVVPRKRLDLFLGAGADLIAQGRDLKLTVVGGFPFAKGFQELLEVFPYPDRLTYQPHASRAEVRALLEGAAVLVQPSEEENFGSSVAEALACGTAVVVGPTNGTGDYIDKGGVRFAEYRVGAVSAAVSDVLDRLAAAPAEVRGHARAAATAHFSVSDVVDGLETVFHETLHH